MSKTDKDKRLKYVLAEAEARFTEDEAQQYVWRTLLPSCKRKAGKGNLTKGYENGPGGRRCSCCGVNEHYKHQMRHSAIDQISEGLMEYAEMLRVEREKDDGITL